MSFHGDILEECGIHIINAFDYVDAAARNAATGLGPEDIGKVAHQLDNDTFWVLISTSPSVVWREITTPVTIDPTSSPGITTDNALVRWDGSLGEAIQDSNAILDDSGNLTLTGGSTLSIDNIQESSTDNGVLINGVRHYPESAVDPTVGPAPTDGDRYYNTALEMEMRYDGTRGKWLSVESVKLQFGRRVNTAAGSYFEGPGEVSFTSVVGFPAMFNGTVVSMGISRSDTDAATIEVTRDGTLVTGATLATSATYTANTSTDADFLSGGVLGVRNQSGGNTITDGLGWIRLRWRA